MRLTAWRRARSPRHVCCLCAHPRFAEEPNPFSGLDKGKVLQDKRLFNETPIKAKECVQLITKGSSVSSPVRLMCGMQSVFEAHVRTSHVSAGSRRRLHEN